MEKQIPLNTIEESSTTKSVPNSDLKDQTNKVPNSDLKHPT